MGCSGLGCSSQRGRLGGADRQPQVAQGCLTGVTRTEKHAARRPCAVLTVAASRSLALGCCHCKWSISSRVGLSVTLNCGDPASFKRTACIDIYSHMPEASTPVL